MSILISFVIPSYNKDKQLPRLLDSIVSNHKFNDSIEIIVCDDCSTDNTTEVVKNYLEKYNNVKYILAKENSGVHYVRNLGMQNANGEYIAFIDGDDYLNSEGLEIVIDCIQNNSQYNMLFFPYITSDTNEKTGFSKKDAEKAVNAFMDVVKDALKDGEKVSLVGFGTFEVVQRAERKGRNPQTGAEITIAACKAPKFRAGKALKEAVS